MKISLKQPVALACVFTWIGFVCAISFMEAWLKFRAPGVTLAIGLGIGKLVFALLNKVEWIFALALLISAVSSRKSTNGLSLVSFATILLILTLQSLWLLPALDLRAVQVIDGAVLPLSNLHLVFVAMEVIKVGGLFILGTTLFKDFNLEYSKSDGQELRNPSTQKEVKKEFSNTFQHSKN